MGLGRSGTGTPLLIDIRTTSLGRVASDATVLASVATGFGGGQADLLVYRDDPQDTPLNVNEDRYRIYTDLRRHERFSQIVNHASTAMNPNLEAFLDGHAFVVKLDPHPLTHHSSALPDQIRGILSDTIT